MENKITVQVGVFPGKVGNVTVEVGTTVADVLATAGLAQGAEQDIKVDGEVVTPDTPIEEDNESVVLAKRIKAAWCGEDDDDEVEDDEEDNE